MKHKIWFGLLLFVAACNKQFVATQYRYEGEKILSDIRTDQRIDSIVQPYKTELNKEMKVVIGYADDALTKTQPESDLGNFMCDVLLRKSREYYKGQIDFTFLNHGGIRLPSLPKGEITIGRMIELMPFDNRILIMELDGITLDTLFNHMAAKGGWHVSGARYKIKSGMATDVTIQNSPLQSRGVYWVAVSDYLAQGGDNCTMLKGKPYIDTKKTLRDALIEGVKEMNERGERVKSVLDGRVQKAE
ncbi:MAG: 5'-nucleotidase C-terminal domain-containing protein [Chitinophagales bacterium]|nr:5'-nucleotidase C-terminal domain-containing protein [Chitinophagales bacterium]